jgi:hypothetical protein
MAAAFKSFRYTLETRVFDGTSHPLFVITWPDENPFTDLILKLFDVSYDQELGKITFQPAVSKDSVLYLWALEKAQRLSDVCYKAHARNWYYRNHQQEWRVFKRFTGTIRVHPGLCEELERLSKGMDHFGELMSQSQQAKDTAENDTLQSAKEVQRLEAELHEMKQKADAETAVANAACIRAESAEKRARDAESALQLSREARAELKTTLETSQQKSEEKSQQLATTETLLKEATEKAEFEAIAAKAAELRATAAEQRAAKLEEMLKKQGVPDPTTTMAALIHDFIEKVGVVAGTAAISPIHKFLQETRSFIQGYEDKGKEIPAARATAVEESDEGAQDDMHSDSDNGHSVEASIKTKSNNKDESLHCPSTLVSPQLADASACNRVGLFPTHGADEDWIIPVRYIASVQQIWPTDDAEPEFSSINLVWRDNVLYPVGDGRYLDSDRYSSWTIRLSDIGTIVYVDDSQDCRLIVERIPPARLLVHLVASHTSTKFVGELIKKIASARIQQGHTFWAHHVLKASMDRKYQNLAKLFHNRHVSTKTFDHKRKRSPEPLLEKDALQVPARTKPRTDHASNAQYTQVYDSASSGVISKARNPRCPNCGRVFVKGFGNGSICEPCMKECPSLRCRQ